VTVIAGFINLYKPVGWTSHDCVAKLRRLLQIKKVGHGGTLDPAAAGVLPVAVGRATRLLQYLPNDKAYRAVVRFGLITSTDDLEGEILQSQPCPELTEAAAIAALPHFIGTIEQIPPRYSAVQVEGKRLYDLARKGQTFEAPKRTVTVHQITPIAWQPGDFPELEMDIACGAGTYIRSIARDLGAMLGTGATLAALKRTKSSGFTQDTSITLEQLEAQLQDGSFELIPPAIALQHLPCIVLADEPAKRWQQGQKIPYKFRDSDLSCAHYQVFNEAGQFLGVTEWAFVPDTDETRLLPKVVFLLP
jgi:tRNA pseudouridine55 synthase